MRNYEHIINPDFDKMNQGYFKVKPNQKVFEKKKKSEKLRKVQIDKNTWVYTKCKTDREAIEKFHKLHNTEDFTRGAAAISRGKAKKK